MFGMQHLTFSAASILLVFLAPGFAIAQNDNAVCNDRDSTVSMEKCLARIAPGAPVIAECKALNGDKYRKCAVKVPEQAEIPVRPSKPCNLPTAREAAFRVGIAAWAPDGITLEEIKALQRIAYNDALQTEIKAAASGTCYTKEGEEGYAAQRKAQREALLDEALRKRCGGAPVRVGMSEDCVYILLGKPNHINKEVRSGKQLVYSNNHIVYINLDGRVENIQSTH